MKRIILIFAVGITLNTAGCAWKVPEFRKVPELTQEKKDFLAKMSVDEERVQNGKLYDWQVEALRQYDYAMGFLQEKYPSHTFKFTFCNPKGNVNPFSYFLFKADNKDDLFNLYLYIDDNHTYSCKDNYYGELLKDSYNAAFLNFLQEYFSECIGVSCYFTNIMGEECDETLTGKEVLDGKLKISNTSYIYAVQPDNSSADILADNIETFIKDNKIYGCYYVNILNSAPDQSYSGDSLRKYVREKNEMVIAQREVNMEKAEH